MKYNEQQCFGLADLRSHDEIDQAGPKEVRCYVRGCGHKLQIHRRGQSGSYCPDHGIRCYLSSAGGTYEYADPTRNLIIAGDEFSSQILRNPFKYESHRFGLERSEDALSWNVFLMLAKAGLLRWFVFEATGVAITREPHLFLWGLEATEATWRPWSLLIDARKRFEASLPVERPLTEPDVAIYVPGQLLILIEVKFCSTNPWYKQGPRANSTSLTLDELREAYQFSGMSSLVLSKAKHEPRLPYQLWRNMVFAEWMAKADSPSTEPFLLNLVRRCHNQQSNEVMVDVMDPRYQHRLVRLDWEDLITNLVAMEAPARLTNYLITKSAGLRPAFDTASASQEMDC